MKSLLSIFLLLLLALPVLSQTRNGTAEAPQTIQGFLFQNAITPVSYVITNEQEFRAFAERIPPFTPYKTLPRPKNPDPFLNGLEIDFESKILVIAVGHDRLEDHPVLTDIQDQGDVREVYFLLPERRAKTHPYGWAVYTAIVLPKSQAVTQVTVVKAPKPEQEDFPRADFPRL